MVVVAVTGTPASLINAKLAEGKAVVFTPGLYRISEPIVVGRSGAVLLGLGMATIMPMGGAGYMEQLVLVKDGLEGVRIAGLVLEAGDQGSSALLRWGTRQ